MIAQSARPRLTDNLWRVDVVRWRTLGKQKRATCYHPFRLIALYLLLEAVNFVNREDVTRTLPRAGAEQLERHRRATDEQRCPLTGDQRENRQVEFINKVMPQQIIPHQAAHK